MQGVLASYWHIGFYAHPRLPELLITGRERDYLAEFIRTYHLAVYGARWASTGRLLLKRRTSSSLRMQD